MAVEVENSRHLFRPRMLAPPSFENALLDPGLHESSDVSLSESTDSSHPPFNFNPLHDLESCWWLGTYLVLDWARTCTPQDSEDAREKDRITKQDLLAYKLFNKHIERWDTMRAEGTFASKLHCLQGNFRRAGDSLEQWRTKLVDCYVNSEKDTEAVLNTDFAGLHDSFIETMGTIIELIKLQHPDPQVRIKKRPRERDGADECVKKPRVA